MGTWREDVLSGRTHDPSGVTVQIDGVGRRLRGPAPSAPAGGPVFVDESGSRGRLLRRAGWVVGLACAGYAGVLGVSLLTGTSDAPWMPGIGKEYDEPAGRAEPTSTAALMDDEGGKGGAADVRRPGAGGAEGKRPAPSPSGTARSGPDGLNGPSPQAGSPRPAESDRHGTGGTGGANGGPAWGPGRGTSGGGGLPSREPTRPGPPPRPEPTREAPPPPSHGNGHGHGPSHRPEPRPTSSTAPGPGPAGPPASNAPGTTKAKGKGKGNGKAKAKGKGKGKAKGKAKAKHRAGAR
ncbi:hypothetical protein [Streptomyces sp. Da 82-17]|uniref:hypothetical protein n=1 Tax=Streptomyces sp. Da 82-17 TaxID=3377116 RepID=UPI0038D4FF14